MSVCFLATTHCLQTQTEALFNISNSIFYIYGVSTQEGFFNCSVLPFQVFSEFMLHKTKQSNTALLHSEPELLLLQQSFNNFVKIQLPTNDVARTERILYVSLFLSFLQKLPRRLSVSAKHDGSF